MIPVLYIYNIARPGGVEVIGPVILMQHALIGSPAKAYIIFGIKPGEINVFKDSGVEYDEGPPAGYRSYFTLYKYTRKHRNWLIHINNCSPLAIISVWLGGAKRIVYTIHGERYGTHTLHRLWGRLLWNIALFAKPRLLSNSNYTAASFRAKICSRASISTVYNPLHIGMPNTPIARTDGQFNVIYVGRLEPGKNMIAWIDLARDIARYRPNARFHIYGDGSERLRLEQYAKQIDTDHLVHFHGYIKDIGTAYAQADLMIFLSKYESFGNVVVESLAYGVPVICSDIPSLREIMQGNNDFLVPLNNAISTEVMERIDRYDALKLQVDRMKSEIIAKHSIENHVKQLLDVYNTVLQAKA